MTTCSHRSLRGRLAVPGPVLAFALAFVFFLRRGGALSRHTPAPARAVPLKTVGIFIQHGAAGWLPADYLKSNSRRGRASRPYDPGNSSLRSCASARRVPTSRQPSMLLGDRNGRLSRSWLTPEKLQGHRYGVQARCHGPPFAVAGGARAPMHPLVPAGAEFEQLQVLPSNRCWSSMLESGCFAQSSARSVAATPQLDVKVRPRKGPLTCACPCLTWPRRSRHARQREQKKVTHFPAAANQQYNVMLQCRTPSASNPPTISVASNVKSSMAPRAG